MYHYNYLIFHGRNMPPYKSYLILMQILFVTTIVKRGPCVYLLNKIYHWPKLTGFPDEKLNYKFKL